MKKLTPEEKIIRDKEKKVYMREYYLKNKQKMNKQSLDNHYKNREERKKTARKYYEKNKLFMQEQSSRNGKLRGRKYRDLVIKNYGGCCQCCGIEDYEFLTVDHINSRPTYIEGDNKLSGRDLYIALIKNGYPKEGYQLLCINCNFAKGVHGECPHTRQLRELREYKNYVCSP